MSASTDPASSPRRKRLGLLLLLVGVATAVAVFIVLNQGSPGLVTTPPTPAPTIAGTQEPSPRSTEPVVIAEFDGEGGTETDEFTVAAGWEIHWETSGRRFAIAADGDEDLGSLVEHQGAGGGSTYPEGSGTFSLSITADGPWSLTIVSRPPP